MSQRNTIVRSLHDVGLAVWLGGSLAGAVGINGAAAKVSEVKQRLPVASAGWARWSPVNLAAITTHLVGGAGVLFANKDRMTSQRGVGASTVAKLAFTGAALSATAYSGVLGRKVQEAGEVPVQGATEPSDDTPAEVASAQRHLKVCQWAIPALTTGIAVISAIEGEQQRPAQVLSGVLTKPARLLGL